MVRGLLVIVRDDKVGQAAMLLSDELGLPIVRGVGNGIVPVVNVEEGRRVIEELLRRINEDLVIVVVVGCDTWSRIENTVPPIDMARLLMRVNVRRVD